MRKYFTRPKVWVHSDPLAPEDKYHPQGQIVWEQDEIYDIGLLDAAGNKILAREARDPIGFVRHEAVQGGERSDEPTVQAKDGGKS